MSEDLVIGIDLGTTNSCAAYYKDNNIVVLENCEGDRTTPSRVVYNDNDEQIVNKLITKRLIDRFPKSGVYDVKRLLGKGYHDDSITKFKELAPYKIIDNNGDIELELITVVSKQVIKQTPEEISSHVLKKLKHDIESKFGHNISNVVITIPAYFNVRQREATLKAGELAGFNVLKLLNEPTAAALAYFHDVKNCPNNKYYLVYDLGGGTFDVSILKKTENEINVVGTNGDVNLGGYDFDLKILEYVTDSIKQAHNDFNITNFQNERLIRRIQNTCEEAKRELSTKNETSISIARPQGVVVNDDEEDEIMIDISRSQFENLCLPLFTKTINIVENCLKGANLSKDDIEEVILCGGSSRIPKIQNMLSTFFGGKKLQKTTNLDECVAEGAALQAAMLSKCEIQKTLPMRITDVVSLSIRVSDFVDSTTVLIKRNAPLPVTCKCPRKSLRNNQTNALFQIYEGERLEASKNYFLGSFALNNLTPAPPGKCVMTLELTLDTNGILTCTATETVSNNTNIVKIDYNKQHIGSINSNITDARENAAADKSFKEFSDCKVYVRKYCINFNYNITKKNLMDTYKDIYNYCNEIDEYVEQMMEDEYEQLKTIKIQLIETCESIVNQHSFKLMPKD